MLRTLAWITIVTGITVTAVAGAEIPYAPAAATISPLTEQVEATPNTYGTTALIKLTLSPWDFVPLSSEVTYQELFFPTSIYRTNPTGDLWFQAPLHLPAGALLSQFEINYCDTGADAIHAFLQAHDIATGAVNGQTLFISSGTPGCTTQQVIISPLEIDNNAKSYIVQVNLEAPNSTIRLGIVRVGYRLQVSPAPGTATFADVPVGHPFHRFVEALAAAGITAGCGSGNFCPNDPVTRGQMAVFLSAALGLHWPN